MSKLRQDSRSPVIIPPKLLICFPIFVIRLSQWLRGLRRRSAVAGLLGFGVRFREGHGCLSLVNVVYYPVELSASG